MRRTRVIKWGSIRKDETRERLVMSIIKLPPDLKEWALSQEGGMSAMVRRLLVVERRRREGKGGD